MYVNTGIFMPWCMYEAQYFGEDQRTTCWESLLSFHLAEAGLLLFLCCTDCQLLSVHLYCNGISALLLSLLPTVGLQMQAIASSCLHGPQK